VSSTLTKVSTDPKDRWRDLGSFIREQRGTARLSLRRLSELAGISNPYLSQIERGLHQPSIAVVKSLAQALNLSVGDLLAHAADIVSGDDTPSTTEASIRRDPRLNDTQKSALLAVYTSMVSGSDRPATTGSDDADIGGSAPGGNGTP